MRERLIHSTASNWVDRGQPPEPELARVLSYYLDLGPEPADTRLRPHVEAVRGMVEADATEVQVAGYLKSGEREFGVTDSHARRRRAAAIALWHIAKCAEVRERASAARLRHSRVELPLKHSRDAAVAIATALSPVVSQTGSASRLLSLSRAIVDA